MRTSRVGYEDFLLWPVLLFGRAKEREQHFSDQVEGRPSHRRG